MNNDSHRPVIHRLHRYPRREPRDFRNPLCDLFSEERVKLRGCYPHRYRSRQRKVLSTIDSRMVVEQLRNRPRQTQIQSKLFQVLTGLLPTSIIYPLTLFGFSGVPKLILWPVGIFRFIHLYGRPPPLGALSHTNHLQCKSIFANFVCVDFSDLIGRRGGGVVSNPPNYACKTENWRQRAQRRQGRGFLSCTSIL